MANTPTGSGLGPQAHPSSNPEVHGLDLIQLYNSTCSGSSSEPQPPGGLDLQMMGYVPPPTPNPAPIYDSISIPSQYHEDRAHWHQEAAAFHRQRAASLIQLASMDFDSDLSIPSEQPVQAIASLNDSSGQKQEKKNNKSRISASGAIQKVTASGHLPAHLTRALLSEPGLQQHAGVKDPSELHPRILGRLNFDSRSVYDRLLVPPVAWGGEKGDRFQYNEFGELLPGDCFTQAEMRTYLFNNPTNFKKGTFKPKEGLTLWLQRNPSDSKSRYGNPASSRCRFRDCIAAYSLIGQGHNRICFDELSHRGDNLDPFHNAGYVHVYCLERFMNFPLICRTLNVKVEEREFPLEPKGKNRMLLSSQSEIREAKKFIRRCENNKLPKTYPHFDQPNRPYKGTLNHRICVKKVEAEPPRIKQARIARGDRLSTLSHHLGDLELETEHRQKSRRPEYQNRRQPPGNGDSENENEDEDAEESETPETPSEEISLPSTFAAPPRSRPSEASAPAFAGLSRSSYAASSAQPIIEETQWQDTNKENQDDGLDDFFDFEGYTCE